KIINYWDSLGNPIVTNGHGICNCYFSSGSKKLLRETGKVINGLRDSIWSGYVNDTLVFIEKYSVGQFLGGVSYYGGKQYTYKEFEEYPEFNGGYEKLMEFLRKNLRYPVDARRRGMNG